MLIAVDTGGTKTLVATFNSDGTLGEQYRFETPSNPGHYIDTLSDFLMEHYSTIEVDAIIMGIPGTISGDVALWCDNLRWRNFNVVASLREALAEKQASDTLRQAPIAIENDANLAGLAETRTLKTIPALSLYVTVSTGVGTGIITHGKLDAGLARSEGGRMQLEWKGRHQEWQDFASGKAIKQAYGKYARDITSVRTWNQIADRISRGLLAMIPVLQPDVIIIGGSIGTYFERYELRLERILHEKLPDHIPTPVIIAAKHPEQAVIYGCYYYALDRFAHQ